MLMLMLLLPLRWLKLGAVASRATEMDAPCPLLYRRVFYSSMRYVLPNIYKNARPMCWTLNESLA